MYNIDVEILLNSQNVYLLPNELHVVKVATKVVELQMQFQLHSLAAGNNTFHYDEVSAEHFVTMLEYAALTRKDYIEYNESSDKNINNKIKHIKHLRTVFPILSLKFAKQLAEMSESLDPNKYTHMNAESNDEALNALREKLMGTTNKENN